MIILTLRTDKPEAEVGLYKDSKQLAYCTWQAHRQLAETIHHKLREVIETANEGLQQVDGIVVYKGPGSFTGLRIGHSVANALADSLKVPIVARGNDNWLAEGLKALDQGLDEGIALPDYGAPPKTTQQKK